jgi:hypothetical protein
MSVISVGISVKVTVPEIVFFTLGGSVEIGGQSHVTWDSQAVIAKQTTIENKINCKE